MKNKANRFLNITLAFALLLSMQFACNTISDATGEAYATGEAANSTSEPADTNETVTDKPGTWLIMMYQNADDEVLEEDIFIDLNEAEIVGSTDQVTIVAQLDRFAGAYDGDGDWTSTKRYLVTQDDDLETIHSEELADLGEMDSGNKNTLVDFAEWAINTYPAEHYVLLLSDHGAGWSGGWNDDDPIEGSSFSMQNIDDALGTVIADTGIDAFELVGFDACLMGQLEVMSAIAPHARYAVGSEETEPSLGWAYASFLSSLNNNTAMTGNELGQAIVDSYLSQDFRITDEQARAAYAGDDSSAESVAAGLIISSTLSVVDLSEIQGLNAAVNELAVALTGVDQGLAAEARAYAQSYESVFGDEVPPSYIDLGHFVDLLLSHTDDPTVAQAAEQVKSALAQTVTAEMHGDEKSGSSGLTIYFPNSELYEGTFGSSPSYGIQYSAYIGRFATASLWDDFLTFHYTGKTFDPTLADLTVLTPAQSTQTDFTQAIEESSPDTNAEVAAPGTGVITIAPISVSANKIGPDEVVTLSTDISGSNIGYIYYYVSYYDQESGSYLTADMGYISSDTTRESGGIYYPDWGNESVISIDYDWEPTLYYMSDGNEANDQFAFFEPSVYGADASGDVYTVRGVFKFADSGSEIDAVMKFNGEGDMQSIFGFNGENGSGAPREITPQAGDKFTITEEWLDFDQNPDGEFVDYIGGTMTFGDYPFEMVPYYAYSGGYTLGIIVTDLNGNSVTEFVEVTVTE